jgi:hypothetical protein
MDIVVTVKRVPDPNIPANMIAIDESGTIVSSPGVVPIINGYDANALEEAVRLRDQDCGTGTALTVGDEATRDTLRHAIAVGATSAVHIAESVGFSPDTFGTASTRTTGQLSAESEAGWCDWSLPWSTHSSPGRRGAQARDRRPSASRRKRGRRRRSRSWWSGTPAHHRRSRGCTDGGGRGHAGGD